jgi:hypothetical protein
MLPFLALSWYGLAHIVETTWVPCRDRWGSMNPVSYETLSVQTLSLRPSRDQQLRALDLCAWQDSDARSGATAPHPLTPQAQVRGGVW